MRKRLNGKKEVSEILQDLLHELELASYEHEKMRMELIVNFFNESEHKRTMNKMRQLFE